MIKGQVVDAHIGEITDFFELCAYAAERKCLMLRQSPYIMDFVVRAFYSQRETISEDISKRMTDEMGTIFATYFSNVDFSKFRDDVNPTDVFQMLAWMTDGYLHEKQRTGQTSGLDEVMKKYKLWSAYLKKMSYKEEFLS